jgi:TRAP transporter TAXI family solute receptor
MGKFTKIGAALGLAMVVSTGASAQERQFINIGTAGIGGGYYPTGGFICNVLNKSRKDNGHNIRCTVESTGGSVANMRSIQVGDLDVGIAMSAWQFHSWNGSAQFAEDGKNEDLRFMFSLHADAAHIVTRADTGIESFADLEGKIVNTGNAGSGTEAQVYAMLERYGVSADTFFQQETKLTSKEQAQALCDGKIDAFFYPTAVGAASILEATNTCEAKVLNWNDDVVAAMMEEQPYVIPVVIPAGTYAGQDGEVVSWGTPATINASANAPEDVIYHMTKAVFDDFEAFKAQSPMYKAVQIETAATAGRTAPYHPGAERYFREVGLLK